MERRLYGIFEQRMEHLMMDKDQVLATLTRINGNVEVVPLKTLMSGRFTVKTFPFRNGPKPASCRYNFLPRVSEPSEVVIRISSGVFKPLMSDEALERWTEYMSEFATAYRVLAVPHRRDFHERLVSIVVERRFVLKDTNPKTFYSEVSKTVMFWQRSMRALEMRALASAVKDKKERDSDVAIAEGLAMVKKVKADSEAQAVLKELNTLVGLHSVKGLISKLAQQQQIAQLRQQHGLTPVVSSPHLVFLGNPGTGKTTVAHLVGKLYKSMGLLTKGHVVEADRSTLIGPYLGQTAIRTKEMCQKALGGVLFIDEAYSLDVNGRDYGQEAVETLLTFMEAHRGEIAVVVAGYPKEMQSFLGSNPGIRSRFDHFLHFEDYGTDELLEIFDNLVRANEYQISPMAREEVRAILGSWQGRENFGNARDVRTLFNEMVAEQASALSGLQNITKHQLQLMTSLAIPESLRVDNMESVASLPPFD
jgi:Cdc6-like AAA superfamily ATPase